MGDDELCGAETSKGGTCQNPADSCPWHNTDDPPDTGRDFTLSEDDHDDILEAAKLGMSKAGCARAAGTGPDQLQRYLNAHEDFREAFMRARFTGEKELVRNALYKQDPEGPTGRPEMNDQHARFLLSTSFDYIKTEKRELTGEDGGAIEVSSDVVTVTESD